MIEPTSILNHQFAVAAPARVVGVPEAHTAWNQFDENGLLMGLPRNAGETNDAYRRRIMDIFVHRANASYRGLLHGVTRELGLSLFQPLQINPRRAMFDNRFYAPDPYIKFDGAFLYLYSDYVNGVLDHKIDRYDGGGNYEHITRLVDFVNTTTYFEASLEPGFDPYLKSMTIANQSNRVLVPVEDTQISTKFQLQKDRIVPSTFLSNNSEIFGIEVASEALVTSLGKYYIDYNKGIVRLFSTPGIGTAMRYEHNVFPFKPIASEVILHDINDENFRIKMFEQILGDDGLYVHGSPTKLGTEIINELMTVMPMYWGL